MNKVKIEIKSIFGEVLFEYNKENNTLIKTLEKAVSEGANLKGANLQGANLQRANLYEASLQRANLYEANLEGANLKGANLKGANLQGANLQRANLYEASLQRANLYEANLEGAYLYLWDNEDINTKKIIKEITKNNNLVIKNTYVNKHILSPYYLTCWKNGLIIDEYETVEKKEEPQIKELTLQEIADKFNIDIDELRIKERSDDCE